MNEVWCTIKDGTSYIILMVTPSDDFVAFRTSSPKSEPLLSTGNFFGADDLTIPPAAKDAVRKALEEERAQREQLGAKIQVGGKMYLNTKAYFDDQFNRVIDSIVRHPKFKKKVGRI